MQQNVTKMERRAAFSLASIYSLRMMGLFMILPIFSIYVEGLDEMPSGLMIGLAIGIYGLTQAIFQIPFGMLSDRIGRKTVITIGLLIFAGGSVVAAMADSIGGLILGRALQGCGAIAAAIMALAADLTREEHRTKVMATIGVSIGLSFAFSMVMGPLLAGWVGMDGIFWLTALLALIGIVVLIKVVPNPRRSTIHHDAEPILGCFNQVFKNVELVRLDIGIFLLHMTLTASFVVLPFALRDGAGLPSADHWMIYLPVLLLSLVLMVPFVILAERYRHLKGVFVTAIFAIAMAQGALAVFSHTYWGVVLLLFLFFVAFNTLEALLPSLVVKSAPAALKGTAMGVYSTSQFLGAFVGGVMGGFLYGRYGLDAVFVCCGTLTLIWGFIASTMKNPSYFSSHALHVGVIDADQAHDLEQRLRLVDGVAEATVVREEEAAYIKYDRQQVTAQELEVFSVDDERSQADSGAERV